MKLVSILRHAKSSWKEPGRDDHDRPLAPRGWRDLPRVGHLLAERPPLPDRVLCSTALRARDTALGVLEAAGSEAEVRLQRRLYLAGPETWLQALAELDEGAGHALLVGHNPGMEELVAQLTGEQQPMPTAALARVQLPRATWSEAREGGPGTLLWLWRPKALPPGA